MESKTKLPEKAEHLLFKLINPGLKQPEADYFSLSLRSWSRCVTGSTSNGAPLVTSVKSTFQR